jgi:beta-galactosidase
MSRAAAENLRRFTAGGGTVLVTPYSGIADETDTVYLGGYPGALRDVLGVRSEEFYPLVDTTVALSSGGTGTIWSEAAESTGAEVRDTYALPATTARTGVDAASGPQTPAWLVNRFGEGTAHYLTTFPDDATLDRIVAAAAEDAGVSPVAEAPVGVEVVRRAHADGRSWLFCINHTGEDAKVKTADVTVDVPAGEVVVHREHA